MLNSIVLAPTSATASANALVLGGSLLEKILESNAIGAFLGAFFAFCFGLITFWYQKKRDRITKHKNELRKLEGEIEETRKQSQKEIEELQQ